MYIEKIDISKELMEVKEANDKYIEINEKLEEFERKLEEQKRQFKKQIGYDEALSNLYKKEKELDNKKEKTIYNIYNSLCDVVNKKLISFNKLASYLDDLDIYFDIVPEELYFEENDENYALTYYCDVNCRDFQALEIKKDSINELIDILNEKLKEIYKKEGK